MAVTVKLRKEKGEAVRELSDRVLAEHLRDDLYLYLWFNGD